MAELERLALGWWHLGNDRLARESLQAAGALLAGEDFADAGHTEYVPVAYTTDERYAPAS